MTTKDAIAISLADTTERFLNALMLQYEARQHLISSTNEADSIKAQKMEGDAEAQLIDLHKSLRNHIAKIRTLFTDSDQPQ